MDEWRNGGIEVCWCSLIEWDGFYGMEGRGGWEGGRGRYSWVVGGVVDGLMGYFHAVLNHFSRCS